MPKTTISRHRVQAFICEHALVTRSRPWTFSLSPRRSAFTGIHIFQATPRRLSAGVLCKFSSSEGDTPDDGDVSGETEASVPRYFVTYESWRNPNWLRLRTAQDTADPASSRPTSSEPIFQLPKEQLPLKITCSAALLSLVGLLSLAYCRLNSFTQEAFRTAAASGISRELHVGRVVRCNPLTGLKLRNVSLPVSAANPTAPAISASEVEVYLSGFLQAIFMRRALCVNVRLHDAEILVSQVVVDGPNGVPVSEWDPGLYFLKRTGGDAETSQQSMLRLLRFFQPGHLSIRGARVLLQPADFLDYGHGDEVVQIEDASADVTFPVLKPAQPGAKFPIEFDGDFKASVKGAPVDGGSIAVNCQMNGNIIPELKPEDPVVSLHVTGEDVRANRVAAFLSLPFRADEGVCAADISIDFLYKSKSLVPLMRGEAQLSSVALRFHPDPKTPEFHDIDGKLRFEGKTLFLDGPVGELGTLPMTVVGDIHLEDGYNLRGYVRPVDVNNILDTFDVDKFVPVAGLVAGEAQLSGPLEEPVIAGWAESVSQNSLFDRLPLHSANVSFEWDAIAGILRFSEIVAEVKGGGSVTGSGSLFFDMTKESPYGICQKEHSPRSPKALYWNPAFKVETTPPLRPLPRDELEIDPQAPLRPYDSMRFDFKAVDMDGGDLLKYYGGEYGQMATKAIGLVSGEGVVAGHAKDANCRVVWRSTTPPPPIELHPESGDPQDEDDGNTVESRTVDTVNAPQSSKMRGRHGGKFNKDQDSSVPQAILKSESTRNMLGGGEFRGLIYLKLGDLPDARRVKVRTAVKNFDLRRAGWADPRLRPILAHSPLIEASMDTYFKGVMSQRELLVPGQNKVSRTPRMELLGADGALAVKNLTMNNVKFEKIMNGSFSFSSSDFSLSLKEVLPRTPDRNERGRTTDADASTVVVVEQDELTATASLKGTANFCFRLGSSEMIASVSKDELDHQVAMLFARNVAVEDFIGEDTSFSSGEALAGVVNVDMKLDLTSRRGDGNVSLERARVGPMNFSSVVGNLVWRDRDLFLEGGTVKYRRSVYQIDARYSASSSEKPEFGWEVNVNIPRAQIHDVAALIQSGNDVATAMQSPADKISQGGPRYSGGPGWIQRLSHSGGREAGTVIDDWEVPEELPFSEQLEWFHQYLEDRKNIMKLSLSRLLDDSAVSGAARYADVDGDISGRVTLKYNSRSGENQYVASNASAVLQAILDQLTRTSFSFELGGTDWRVGPAVLNKVVASGTFEDGVLNIGPVACEGRDGFWLEALGRITSAGSVTASSLVRKVPAALLNQFSQAPVNVTGECNGRLEVEGSLSNPRAFGRIVWTDATLNGQQVRGAKTDLACINGRCLLNADARIGGRQLSSQLENEEAGVRSLQWGESVISGLNELASQVSSKAETPRLVSSTHKRKEHGESLQVRISAPVRFYLLKYLQSRAPSSFWSELEPVLGGKLPSDDEWVLMDVDVKKYGLVLLNTALPELGWESGDSDIRLRVSGTLANPVVKGRISVSNGRVSPSVLSNPLQGLRGEIDFTENGIVSLKSVSGRCNGKALSANGNMFFTDGHRERLMETISRNRVLLRGWQPTDALSKKERKDLQMKQNAARIALQRGSRGIAIEFGDFPVHFQDIVLSKLSGKIRLAGTASKPIVGGMLTFSDGLIYLGNAALAPQGILGAGEKSKGVPVLFQEGNRSTYEQNRREPSIKKENQTIDRSDKSIAPELEQRESPMTDMGIPYLDGLRISLGRNMQVVQPFLLNLDTAGTLVLNGSPVHPEITGAIRVLRGRVNVLATRMSVRKDTKNYLKFVRTDESSTATGKAPEPVINATLEGDDLLVRIPECSLSTWADHIIIKDKSGAQLSDATWDAFMLTELGGLRSPEAAARLLAKYIVKAVETGGKAGMLEWRAFPALVSKSGGFSTGRLRDELGVGGEFEFGGLAVGTKWSTDGTYGGRIRLRLGDWLKWEVETEGVRQSSSVEVVINKPLVRGRDKEDPGDDNDEVEEKGTKKKGSGGEEGIEQEDARRHQQTEKEEGADPKHAEQKDDAGRKQMGEEEAAGLQQVEDEQKTERKRTVVTDKVRLGPEVETEVAETMGTPEVEVNSKGERSIEQGDGKEVLPERSDVGAGGAVNSKKE